MRQKAPHVLIIVENLPVPHDRRVWQESQALVAAGYRVSVICPQGKGQPRREQLAGVELHRYPAPPESGSKLAFVYEYAYSWLMAFVLTLRLFLTEGFDAIQACNPPDTYFLLALPYKALGRAFVFDHHDLAPELFTVRFGARGRLWLALLRALERATYRTADHVISTSESYRRLALTRGGRRPEDVTIVRNGPQLALVPEHRPQPELKEGKPFLCCWVGVMGAVDDGLDLALEAIAHLVHVHGRTDCLFTFLGSGESLEESRRLAEELRITESVRFTGWVAHERVLDYLATADLGLQPDPKNPRTDLAAAVKTVEYMALGLPVVAFDVDETRATAGDAGAYAEPNRPESLAAVIDELLDDPPRREAMGRAGRQKVAAGLAWEHQEAAYVAVYDRLLGGRAGRPTS